MHEYRTARGVFGFAEFLGWALVVGGGIIAIAGFSAASAMSSFGRGGGFLAGTMAAMPGLGVFAIGLVVVIFVQIGRASVDTSERVGQLIRINTDGFKYLKSAEAELPKSFALSKQASHRPHTPAAPTTAPPPVQKPPIKETIGYKGRQIEVDEQGVPWVGSQNFVSIGAARIFVNQLPPARPAETVRSDS